MNPTFRYVLLSAIAVAAATDLQAGEAQGSLPVVEILGSKYYVYTAKKGDSLFGIARTYGWDDETLARLNPTAVSPLKKGMLIYYPTGEHIAPAKGISAKPDDNSEIRHTVKRGETVYAISKIYNIPVERIYTLNPSSRDGIKAGESLVIRKAGNLVQSDNSEKSVFYCVKSGDTLYGLSQRYGVSVAAIMEQNPGIDEENFKAGSTVKIPKKGSGVSTVVKTVETSNLDSVEIKQVSKKDTWNSLAQQTGVSVDVLKEANPSAKLKNKEYIAVPKVEVRTEEKEIVEQDPRETTSDGIAEIYENIHNVIPADSIDIFTVKVAVVSENVNSKKDREFLRGFLAGIDKQKRNDYKIEFKVVNASDGAAHVVDFLNDFHPTVVFTTSDTNLAPFMAQYAVENRTPVVNTFDVKSTTYTDNPYVVQMLTPPSLFNDNVAHYVHERFGDRTIVFVGEEDKHDQLAESLYAVWDASKIKTYGAVESIVPEMFAEDGKYLVYGYDVKKSEVAKLADAVASVRAERPLADVSLLGRPNLIVYEDAMESEFKKADLKLPSRFYIDKDSREYREFLQSYKSLWDRNPSKSLPLYAAVGYDASIYFVSELAHNRGDINKLSPSRGTVQSDFELYRPSNWSGFLNPPVYLIDFTPVGAINKNVIYYAE